MDASNQALKLLAGVREIRQVYEEMVGLGRHQSSVLAEGDLDQIFELATQKESSLRRAGLIEERIRPLKVSWPEYRESVPGDVRDQVEAAFTDLKQLLSQLVELEAEAENRLKARHTGAADRIRKLAQGRQVQNAYGAGRPGPRLLDQQQ